MPEPAQTTEYPPDSPSLTEHPLQSALQSARMTRFCLVDIGRIDLAHIIDLAIDEIEREIRDEPSPH